MVENSTNELLLAFIRRLHFASGRRDDGLAAIVADKLRNLFSTAALEGKHALAVEAGHGEEDSRAVVGGRLSVSGGWWSVVALSDHGRVLFRFGHMTNLVVTSSQTDAREGVKVPQWRFPFSPIAI